MSIRIKGFDHIVLRVADVRGVMAFYCEVLGCSVDTEREDLGLYHLRAGPQMIDLVDLNGPLGQQGGAGPGDEGHNLDHFCLRIEPWDAAAIAAHLAGHGIDASEPARRYGADGTGPSIYIRDPAGNTVELKGPPLAETDPA